MLSTLNPVLSKSNAFKISTKLHGICRAESFCPAPHHSRKQSYGKWTVKMISLSETLCLVYIVDSDLCQREHDPYISPNSSTLEHQSFCHFLVPTAWVLYYVSKLSNWVLSGHNHRPIKSLHQGYLDNDYRNEKKSFPRVFCCQTRRIASNISSLTSK